MAIFAATMVGAILRGRAGAPCACFGARSTVGWAAVARNAAARRGLRGAPGAARERPLDRRVARPRAGGRAARLRRARASPCSRWRARSGCCACASGRRARSRSPRRGRRCSAAHAADRRASRSIPRPTLALAVFISEGCHVCRRARALDPGRSPATRWSRSRASRSGAEAEVWSELEIPGSPFAVALDREGTVLAKGTFNNLAQLESVLRDGRAPPGRARPRAG